jgi:hypothetical protein
MVIMFNKIMEKLNSINKFSKHVIIAGSITSVALCIIGISLIAYNKNVLQTISMYTLGTSLVYSAITLFSEFTIGGLVIDVANNVIKNHND